MFFYLLFPIISSIIIFGTVALVLSQKCNFSQGLSRIEVDYYQRKIDIEQKYQDLIQDGSCEISANRLGLSLSTTSENDKMSCFDSVLRPTDKTGFLGEIICKEDQYYDDVYGANFRRYHEIIHYVDDVGIGKRVRKSYAKDPTGETRSHREQIVNFKAAAVAIPKERLLQDLCSCNEKQYNSDEFLRMLQNKYKQPIQTITRRIYEVSRKS